MPVEVQLPEIAQSGNSTLRDLSEIVVIEIQLDEGVDQIAIECIVVDALQSVPVEDQPEDGEALECVGRDRGDGCVNNHQRIDLNPHI